MLGSRGKSSSLFRIAGVDENLREPRIERLSWAGSGRSLRFKLMTEIYRKLQRLFRPERRHSPHCDPITEICSMWYRSGRLAIHVLCMMKNGTV
jgi:hypothetical protein